MWEKKVYMRGGVGMVSRRRKEVKEKGGKVQKERIEFFRPRPLIVKYFRAAFALNHRPLPQIQGLNINYPVQSVTESDRSILIICPCRNLPLTFSTGDCGAWSWNERI